MGGIHKWLEYKGISGQNGPMSSWVSMNGELVSRDAAVISIFDRGFLYGDSVYEVMRTYKGVPFELDRHLSRLASSAVRIGMRLSVSGSSLAREIRRTHEATGNSESYIRVICTRGGGQIGLDPELAENPASIVIAEPVKSLSKEIYEKGAAAALVTVRRNLKAAIDPQAKTGNYLNSILALREATEGNYLEAIMRDHRDFITEGASSNVFAVIGGMLLTPPLEAGILEGITRAVVCEVSQRHGIRTLELPLTEAALKQADEVFITSSIREIVPIVRVDEQVIGQGSPGPTVKRVRALFADYVAAYTAANG